MSPSPVLKRRIKFRDLVLFYIVVVLSMPLTATGAAAGPTILVVWIAALTCPFIPLSATVTGAVFATPGGGRPLCVDV